MKKGLLYGCLSLAGLALLVVAVLLYFALNAEPLPTTAEALATLPDTERSALTQICQLAKVEPTSLRHIASYEGDIFNHELNHRSLVVRDGHLVALCLRSATFSAVPQFSGLSALEALDLRSSGLTQWPDISGLAALKQIDLSRQPLPTPEAKHLPPSATRFNLSQTQVADTAPLATLTHLHTLDLSSTPVTTFAPLIVLKLESLRLTRSQVSTLPDQLPSAGNWEVDLDETPVLNPPGYSKTWPFDGWITTTTNDGDNVSGTISEAKVDITGTAAPTAKPRAVKLPRCTDPKVKPITLQATCTEGKARLWLEEPFGYFSSPWFTQSKVKGFGTFRKRGYLSTTLSPGQSASLQGSLFLTTHDRLYEMPPGQRNESLKPPDWCDYSFYLQPLEGSTVTGLRFQVTGPN